MTLIDIDTAELAWLDLVPAGSTQMTRMSMLWKDDARGLRSVLVDFPDDWSRDTVGHQPAQEEMLPLTGAMYINGLRTGVGELLVGAPHATRSQTFNDPGTRVLVWFSGQVGGWEEGEAQSAPSMEVVDLAPGMSRPPRDGLEGSVEVHENVGGTLFDQDSDLVWVESRQWLHLAAGTPAPDVPGKVVVKLWG